MDAPRFVTLTLDADDATLRSRIERLQTSFKNLRRSRTWRDHVRGGVYAIEVTRGAAGGHWHVHLHAIIDGTFLPHAMLKAAWIVASDGASIVDIRAVHSRDAAARYVGDYIAKPADRKSWTAEQLCDYAKGVHGVRMIGTFGKCHSCNVDDSIDAEEPKVVETVMPACRLIDRARAGDTGAVRACRDAWRLGGAFVAITLETFPDLVEPNAEPMDDEERSRWLAIVLDVAQRTTSGPPPAAAPPQRRRPDPPPTLFPLHRTHA